MNFLGIGNQQTTVYTQSRRAYQAHNEKQTTPDQAAKLNKFFGDDSMAAINQQRELSGARKVYGDYAIELLGTNYDRVAIVNNKDNSILEFEYFGDPNELFNELDKFLEGREPSFDLFAEFFGESGDDSIKQIEETTSEVFTNPKGERILMIKTPFGISYIKIGEATDFLLTENKNAANIEAALEAGYNI